jgi:hypothetical protein
MNISAKTFCETKRLAGQKKSKNKYNAKKVKIDDILFDSKLEAKRYLELKQLLHLGVIKNLVTHKKFPLIVNDITIGSYEADFVYEKDGVEIIEDTKGVLTKEYRLKKKLMKAIYNKDILEVYSKK